MQKALSKNLPVILVINKIDRPDSRINEVIDEVYELFIDLGANDEQIEFPIIYTNAKDGIAKNNLDDKSEDLIPLFELILEKIDGPEADDNKPTQFLVTNLDYDPYLGQIAVGRIGNGKIILEKPYSLCASDGIKINQKLSACFTFKGLSKVKVKELEAGDIIAVSGIEGVKIGDTISDNESPSPLPRIEIDNPTVSMYFQVNNGPLAGREGKYLTSRHIGERLRLSLIHI